MSKEKLVLEAYNYAKENNVDSIDVIDAYIAGASRELKLDSIIKDMESYIKQVEHNTRSRHGWSDEAEIKMKVIRKAFDAFVQSFKY